MYILKRKYIVIISLAILLVVAGYLNWSYKKENSTIEAFSSMQYEKENQVEDINTDEKESTEDEITSDTTEEETEADVDIEVIETSGSQEQSNYFTLARINRDDARSESIYLLNQMIENENMPEETRKEAQKELILLSDLINREATIENLIKAKGFEDAVVFINKDYDVRVVVNPASLNDKKVAQIMDIVVTELDISPEKVKIMEKL